MAPPDDELVLAFPAPIEQLGVANEIRSTLIASSIASLRRHGLYERYVELLAPAQRDKVLSTVPGQWLPIGVGRAHYEACNGLGLSVLEQLEIGFEVSVKLHETFLGVVARTANRAGITPWMLLPRGNQMYARLFSGGGGIRVFKRGPKDARVELAGCPLLDIPYFRNAVRGLYQAAVSLFCMQAYVQEADRGIDPMRLLLRIAWS